MSTQRTCFQKQKELFTNTSSGNLLHRANKTQQVLIKVFSSAGQQLLLTNLSTLLLTVYPILCLKFVRILLTRGIHFLCVTGVLCLF